MKVKPYERLDKFLSNSGLSSRRDIKKFLKQHSVTINDERITTIGFRINTETDEVFVDGQQVFKKRFVYYALNKPTGVISTTRDNWGRESVVDFVPCTEKIYPIGRLDRDTHGLIILTNDGELTHKLIHPKYHVEKKYLLHVEGKPDEFQLTSLREGVLLRDGITLPATISIIESAANKSVLSVTIHEGKNRQIRRMCETVGLTLLDLQRIQFGPIALGDLETGASRELTETEITSLKKAVQR